VSVCRSCGAPIEWAVTENRRRMPVDAEPVVDGNILLEHRGYVGDPPIARIVDADERADLQRLSPEPLVLFVSHFATCPNAAQHRRRAEPATEDAGEPQIGGRSSAMPS
jgi:hypothetical protein